VPQNPHDDDTQSFVPLTKGAQVGHYKIMEKIGAGGMGEVYLAEDTKLKRQVALKFLPHHYVSDKDLRERFSREAQAAAKLDHPNIVPVHEVGEYQGRPYFAMAHIEGQSLRDVIKDGRLGINEAIDLTMQICEGLHKAHEAGVVHRDIKPSNIIIDNDGRARLVDFGLAMVLGEDKLTKTGSTLGTVGYMSPEQIHGKKCDHRSDLFSVGVILYEMLSGRRPFEGDNDAAVVKAITDSTPEPVARFKSGVTGELQQIIDKALSKDPSLRYQHADGMLTDLKRLQIDTPRPKKGKFGLWIAAAVIIIVGGYFGYAQLIKEKPKPAGPKRLVVLPFDNLGDSTQAYFANGMTDEIINRLTSIKDLQVVARRSAAKLKAAGVDISDIGKELGVEYVLDVSTHLQESSTGTRRVKLVTQLIKVSDESVLWGKTYDTVMTEIFTVQSSMAEQVAEQLGVILTPEDKQAVWARFTDSEAAWDYYLKGNNYRMTDSYSRKYLLLSLEMYNQAIEIDSTFARVYSNKAGIYNRLYFFGLDRSDSCKALAKENIDRAFEMERFHPYASRARWTLGDYYYRFERDYPKALRQFEIAYEDYGGQNNPWYHWDAHNCLRRMGRIEEAYDHMKILAEAEPRDAIAQYDLASTCERMRRYEEAEEIYLKAIELKPDYIHSYTIKVRDIIELSWNKIEDTTRWDYWFESLNALEGNLEAMKRYLGDVGSMAWYYDIQGITDSARIYWDSLRLDYEEFFKSNNPTPGHYSYYGIINARLGNRQQALENVQKAMEMMPLSRDSWDGMDPIMALFDCYVFLGDFDKAVEQAEKILQMPAYFDLGLILLDPDFRYFIKYPGFARLIEEYGNDYHKKIYAEKVGSI
jgi:serine/threonine protein kinase/tetratricopeptide (TPR) repeat protein